MGETKTPHFYDFGISEPVTKPQNQLFLFLETPGFLNKIKKSLGTLLTHVIFIIGLNIWETQQMSISKKTGTDK